MMKNSADSFSGLWKKPKPVKTAAPAKPVSRKSLESDRVLAKYSGDPETVAMHAAWGSGRFWPADEAFEQKASSCFQLSADKIVGVLGCGSAGAPLHIAKMLPTFVHGYDWRCKVEDTAKELIEHSGQSGKVLVRTIDLDTVFPPKTRSHGMIAVEPVLTFAQPKVIDWLGLAVIGGGTMVFEEPSLEPGAPEISWFANRSAKECYWQSPGERESALRQAGFTVQRVQETTGGSMRALRAAIAKAESSAIELNNAIDLVPILEPVRDFFTKELNSAKNRLHALEVGDAAVYRYRVIKQRAER